MKVWLRAQKWEATDIGWVLSIGIFALVQWVGFQPASNPAFGNKFTEFLHLRPSEMGDALAGVFSALAFVWIIVTVAMQSTELSEQRKEFEKMAKAQKEQVNLLRIQGEIFELEQKERSEAREDNLLQEKVRERIRMSAIEFAHCSWTFFPTEENRNNANQLSTEKPIFLNLTFEKPKVDELTDITLSIGLLNAKVKAVLQNKSVHKLEKKCTSKDKFENEQKAWSKLLLHEPDMLPHHQPNIALSASLWWNNERLFELIKNLQLLAEADIWEPV
ncbi:hypothetical protein [Planktotalea sp.]|uniref:hypothetical protein n=1 Tax=Planktotalea sp. TaxID=2029877 RepID=UPI003299720C